MTDEPEIHQGETSEGDPTPGPQPGVEALPTLNAAHLNVIQLVLSGALLEAIGTGCTLVAGAPVNLPLGDRALQRLGLLLVTESRKIYNSPWPSSKERNRAVMDDVRVRVRSFAAYLLEQSIAEKAAESRILVPDPASRVLLGPNGLPIKG